MNDNDIIKALECCKIKTPPYKCEECPLLRGVSNSCIYECKELAYDLINRQKAEIEGLCNKLNVSTQNVENMARSMPNIAKATRAEAIKEYAERLKQTRVDLDGIEMVAVGNIDAIAEGMMED